MNRYLILHIGFVMPTPEDMAVWNKWFQSLGDRMVEMQGLSGGREITADGTRELPFQKDSITGYTVIKAASLDEAESIAQECPIVLSTQVHEIRSQN